MRGITFTLLLAEGARREEVIKELEKLASDIEISGSGRLEMQGIEYLTAKASAETYRAVFSLPSDYSPGHSHLYGSIVRPFSLKDKITYVSAEKEAA